jgi:hypothetical protein
MTFYILCGINSKHSDIKKKKGGYILKIITKLCHRQWWHHKFLLQESYNNIGCDDDMEYTEDAIDNMILEFSRD